MTTKKITGIKFGRKELKKYLEKKRGPLTFGRLLQSHRKCEDRTQEELGKKLGISKANICYYEKGR